LGGEKRKTLSQASKKQEMGAMKQEKQGKGRHSKMQFSIKNMMMPKIEAGEAAKIFGPMKAITKYSIAKNLGINASIARSLIKNLVTKGILEKAGGYSGHYVYRYMDNTKDKKLKPAKK
jgi:small subunit ribosomal protein S25e